MEFYCVFFPNFVILPKFKSRVDLRVYLDYGNASSYTAYLQGSLHGMNTICMCLHGYIKLHTQT